MTPRALALLALVLPIACAALAQRPLPATDGTQGAPVLAFTLPADGIDSVNDRTHRVTVWYEATLPFEGSANGYYAVRVLGVEGELLIHTSATLPIDAQVRDLRNKADDAARLIVRRARSGCDSLHAFRALRPPPLFGLACT